MGDMERQRQLQRDELYDAFSRERRRCILRALAETEGPLGLDELARAVAACERGAPPADIAEADVERVRVSLYHCHVPKLADAGLVVRDDEAGDVSLTALGEQVRGAVTLGMQDRESCTSRTQ